MSTIVESYIRGVKRRIGEHMVSMPGESAPRPQKVEACERLAHLRNLLHPDTVEKFYRYAIARGDPRGYSRVFMDQTNAEELDARSGNWPLDSYISDFVAATLEYSCPYRTLGGTDDG